MKRCVVCEENEKVVVLGACAVCGWVCELCHVDWQEDDRHEETPPA